MNDKDTTGHRRSIRLRNFDYTSAGAYFVTIVTRRRELLFGSLVDGNVKLNAAGIMVQDTWNSLHDHYPGVVCDQFVIMPNHIHGIIILVGVGPRAYPEHNGELHHDQPRLSLADVMHRFKSITTKRYIDGVKRNGWATFDGTLWQRNYYERVIRNESELMRIREYIANNPAEWEIDEENPKRSG